MGYPYRDEVIAYLEEHQNESYGSFQAKLMPTVDAQTIVGVRTPDLRKLAKQLARRDDIEAFLADLPHALFEENQLHAFIVSGIRDYDEVVRQLDRFLPWVDNWGTCDQMSCKVLATRPNETLAHAQRWMTAEHIYTIRYGIGVLLEFFLGEHFAAEQLEWVAAVQHDDYYVNMMRAWYFAEALAKQEAAALPFIEEQRLDRWTHNKTIQKAVESRRISPELKAHVRSLRRKQ